MYLLAQMATYLSVVSTRRVGRIRLVAIMGRERSRGEVQRGREKARRLPCPLGKGSHARRARRDEDGPRARRPDGPRSVKRIGRGCGLEVTEDGMASKFFLLSCGAILAPAV